jgi:hypothetical protein
LRNRLIGGVFPPEVLAAPLGDEQETTVTALLLDEGSGAARPDRGLANTSLWSNSSAPAHLRRTLAQRREVRLSIRELGPLPGPCRCHLLVQAVVVLARLSQPSSVPQLWMRVKVVPHLPGSANSLSASRRSEASSSPLNVANSRDSSATLN